MTARTILFDADGVTIAKHGYFSEYYAREKGISIDVMAPFYTSEFVLCQRGKADLKESLKPYLSAWKWEGSVDEFLDYWFTTDAIPDNDVLHEVASLRERGLGCCLATDQEAYRAKYIRETLRFGEVFDDCFFSCDLGFTKSDPAFFTKVLDLLSVEAKDVVYWDDDEKNVTVAERLGIDARVWVDMRVFKEWEVTR